jgi:hypothetical protein
VIVDRLQTRETGDAIERSAVFRWNGGEAPVSVAVPAELAGEADDASPFVPLALLLAMVRGEDLVVDGPVSPLQLRGLTRVRELYLAWAPLYPASVEVAEERAPARRSSEVACLFSRGVDSTYSAAVPRSYPGSLSRLIFIDGFEPAHDAEVDAEEARRAGLVAERLGLPLAVVFARFLDALLPAVGNLDDATAPMLALSALMLGGAAGTVLVPSSDSTETLGPNGTSPVLDPLLSTEAVSLEYDSTALGRVEKGLWLARERPDLLAELKVCFHVNGPGNCGQCQKCLLTMCTLVAAGALGEAHQLPDEIDLDVLRAKQMRGLQPRVEWSTVTRELGETGRAPELHALLLEMLARPGRPYPGAPVRDDTPDFRSRHFRVVDAVTHHRLPWPPREEYAPPPGLGLVRAVDARAGRHVYGVGRLPAGEIAGELGSVPRDAAEDLEPLWATAGGHLTTAAKPTVSWRRRSGIGALRWALAPLAWRGTGESAGARARAALRRAGSLLGGPPTRPAEPLGVVGHLHRHEAPGRLPLLSALHPVTGDQLLCTSAAEATDMGYGEPALLGYIDAVAPLTGTLEPARPPVPWASRFGRRVR